MEGVKMALKVLRDYYAAETAKAHAAAAGAGGGIIGLLEVVESDFQKGLIEMTTTEDASQSTYDKETKENEIERATKDQDVKYKSKESSDLDQAIAEASSDRSGVQSELDAVMQYLKSLEGKCIAKAETFEERKARFEAELAGLKEALKILEGEAMLVQRSAKRTLRGVKQHRA
uniref:Biogenesis of lysosome-related organelles complex 1 subunit 5 n=1 Tax=Alexandrium catenella TaxID=2925 RepID=A0A7S1RUG6_ALECA